MMKTYTLPEPVKSERLKVEESYRNGTYKPRKEIKECINLMSKTESGMDNSEIEKEHGSLIVIDPGNLQDKKPELNVQPKTEPRRELTNIAKMIILLVAVHLIMTSFGFLAALHVVYVDIIKDLGIPRAEAALIMSITRGVMFGSGFISSWVYHMLGPVKCVAFGGVLCSVGLITSSFAKNIILIVLPIGILTGFGGGLMGLTGNTIVASSFGRRKGLALSFCTMGTSIGNTIFAYSTDFLIKQFGWRGSFLIYGGVMFNTLPAAYLLKLNLSKGTRESRRQGGKKFNFGVLGIVQFRLYVMAVLLYGMFGMSVFLFVVDLVESQGYSRIQGATLLSVLGISSSVTRLLFGMIKQLFGFKGLTCLPINSLTMAGVIVTFGFFKNYWMLFASCILCGITYGIHGITKVLAPYEIAGTEGYATALGVTNTIYGIGNAVCGPMGGAMKDTSGRYDIVFFAASIAIVVKAILEATNVFLERTKKMNGTRETK